METRSQTRFGLSQEQLDELRGRELSFFRYEQHRESMSHETAVKFMTKFLRNDVRIQIRGEIAPEFKSVYRRDFVMVAGVDGAPVTVTHRKASVLGGVASYEVEFGVEAVERLIEIGSNDEAIRKLITDIASQGARAAVEEAAGCGVQESLERPRL